uniref:C2H2-type domain-containing protein n=1 Tax=Periophthalmus magnuspinnatus TaxID=409849 RepID=A0A3B3ZMB4_9GOBI
MYDGIEPRNECLLNGYLNQDCGETLNYDVTKLQNYLQQQNSISCTSNGNKEHLQDNVENQGNHISFHEINGNDIENNQFPENVTIDDYSCVAGEQEENDRDFYQCSFCGNRYNSIGALRNHMRGHISSHSTPPSSIPACTLSTKVKEEELSTAVNAGRHKDKQVKSQVQTLTQTEQRSRSEGGELPLSPNASQDPSTENTNKELQESESTVKSEDNSDKRPFACDLCGRTYRHAGSLVNHKNSHKTGEYLCSICNNSYSNQLALKNHLRIHFAFKRHSCLKCGKRLRSRKQLLVHVCTNLKRGRRNFRSKCAKTSAGGGQPIEPPTKKEQFYTCNICNRSYRHAGSLLNHKNTHKTGHYNCSFCSKPFSNLLALRNHTRIHTQKRKYACLTCGKAFRVASVLYNHQKIHSGGASRFSCPNCGKGFRGRAGLQRHQYKVYVCEHCGRTYRHAGSLLNHKNSHKTGCFLCSICHKEFTNLMHIATLSHCNQDNPKNYQEIIILLNFHLYHRLVLVILISLYEAVEYWLRSILYHCCGYNY